MHLSSNPQLVANLLEMRVVPPTPVARALPAAMLMSPATSRVGSPRGPGDGGAEGLVERGHHTTDDSSDQVPSGPSSAHGGQCGSGGLATGSMKGTRPVSRTSSWSVRWADRDGVIHATAAAAAKTAGSSSVSTLGQSSSGSGSMSIQPPLRLGGTALVTRRRSSAGQTNCTIDTSDAISSRPIPTPSSYCVSSHGGHTPSVRPAILLFGATQHDGMAAGGLDASKTTTTSLPASTAHAGVLSRFTSLDLSAAESDILAEGDPDLARPPVGVDRPSPSESEAESEEEVEADATPAMLSMTLAPTTMRPPDAPNAPSNPIASHPHDDGGIAPSDVGHTAAVLSDIVVQLEEYVQLLQADVRATNWRSHQTHSANVALEARLVQTDRRLAMCLLEADAGRHASRREREAARLILADVAEAAMAALGESQVGVLS